MISGCGWWPCPIRSHLHRDKGIGDETFLYTNTATRESAEAWARIHGEYEPTEDNFPGVKGHPAIFEPVINVSYQGDA